MGPSIVEWKKAYCKTVCEKTTQRLGAWLLLGDREFPGIQGPGNKGPFLSLSGKVLWSTHACDSFGIRKASEGILQERKWFGEDLLGQGDRKAEVLLVCCWRMSSSSLTHLSLHWQKREPDCRGAGHQPGPAGSVWRCHVRKTCPDFCPPPALLAFSREQQFPYTDSPSVSEVLIYSWNPPAATQIPSPAAVPSLALGLKSDSSGD